MATVPQSIYRAYLCSLNRVGSSLKSAAVDAEPPDVLADLGVDGRDDGGRQQKGQGRRHDDVDDGGAAGAVVRAGRERFAASALARAVEVERRRG